MIDVFVCSLWDSDEIRGAMAELCLARWNLEEDVNLMVVTDNLINSSPIGFQRMRRIFADETASGDVYVVADDDCLLPPGFNLSECVRVFKDHPSFATLSLMPSNCSISEWTPEKYVTENTPDVMEHVSAGHVRFCRRGHLWTWPPMGDGPGYDAIHAEAIRSEGGRVGYFRHMKALHLGEGYSTVWRNAGLHV